ncbi:DEAD/DEAH box helicase [Streptomyces sp. WMMC500]|uniref:DEAD/DEAH box helicase n=1 Tax=Streptomyces sp. WMMC500 TaxID=3015154 RepID=UPI00248B421D|nr:DEAD/DEAH box helicase [Streptomyces sp. WMMC500]WBB64101.1 DEAD/DEAH box helicase [Streptomyces sp. WMMC500]
MSETPVLDPALEAAETPETGETAETPETGATAPEPTFGDLGLPRGVVAKLADYGVTTPFPIQAATIPDALAGRDVLGRGRTGSGKTLSFGLPLLATLAGGHTDPKRPRGLILTPTRELAMQVADALQPYGDLLRLSMKVVCGGTSMGRQIGALERGVDILVATPGRLRDVIDRGACSLDRVQITVLDEADQMADLGFLPEVTELLDQVPPGGQRMLFSATLDKGVGTLVDRYLVDPVSHEVDPSAGAVTTMSHHVLVVKPRDKAPVTAAIAARRGRTIVFVRTQLGADRVADQLRETGVRAAALHGGMTQGARTHTLADFKDGRVHALVATDVAARGIHVDGIDLVLNVDPAGDHKDYLHRAGRTARAGESGTVVSLALPHQRRTVFRLLEDAAVDASRHIISGRGAFDPDVARITGARSIDEVQADSAAQAATAAERDVTQLEAQLERARRHAVELRAEATRLATRAGVTPQSPEPSEPPSAESAERADGPAESGREEGTYESRTDREDRTDRPYNRTGTRHDRREQRFRAFDRSGESNRRDYRDNRETRDYRNNRESRDYRDNRETRDHRSDRRDARRDDRRDDRSYGTREPRSYDRRDTRGDDRGTRPYDRGTRSYPRRDDRGAARPYDRDNRRPYERRDTDRSRFGGDRPAGRERRDGRPSYGHDRRTSDDRRTDKPRWKRQDRNNRKG